MYFYLDFETYSTVDLRGANVYSYSEDADFEILMMGYAFNDLPVQVAVGAAEIFDVLKRVPETDEWVAHNAMFERIVLSAALNYSPGDYIQPERFIDTRAIAAEKGYPQSLDMLAQALGGEQKDSAGTRLINLFCMPDRFGKRVTGEQKPAEWAQFIEYCRQDVETLRDVHKRLGDFPTPIEREVYNVDQKINDLGMAVDLELVHAAVEASSENEFANAARVRELTGVENPNSNPQMIKWVRGQGLKMDSLRAELVEDMLKRDDLTSVQREVLELRQSLALVASKKYTAILKNVSSDGRLRGGFQFFGAHTGRWSGRGVQPHNFPRAALESPVATEAAILDLKLGLGADDFTLKALVRPTFTGPMVVNDYAAIEARVLAWLAGETWALQAFNDGRDIYVETANRMGPGMTRTHGKVAVLALGYNGGVASLRAMGAEGTDGALKRIVNQWRGTNSNITALWSEMQDAFRLGGPVGNFITVEVDGDSRLIRLPSGRAIYYHDCQFNWVETQYGPKRESSFRDPKAARGFRTRTYGGRLIENVTQAVARDILAEALVRLDAEGYDIIGHVHDEVLVLGGDIQGVSEVMVEAPPWATGLPLGSAGFTTYRYRKD